VTRDEAIAQGMATRGKLLADELGWLYDLAALAPDGAAIEIGAHCGRSVTAWSAARVGRGPIIASDIRNRPELRQTLSALGYPVDVIIAASWDVPALVPDGLAFLFLDADHGIDGFPRDIAVWPQKIAPGGIMVLHDYGVWKPTVVVKEYTDRWQQGARWDDLGAVRSAKAYRRPL